MLHMKHHFMCNISYVVIAMSMGKIIEIIHVCMFSCEKIENMCLGVGLNYCFNLYPLSPTGKLRNTFTVTIRATNGSPNIVSITDYWGEYMNHGE